MIMTETITARGLVLTYVALMGLLALTLGSAYLNLGVANILLNVGIAIVKTGLIMAVFMHLRMESDIVRTFAMVGFFWLTLLLVLSFSDYLTRG